MAKNSLAPEDRRSLAEQIADTERRILERRRSIHTRQALMAQHVRQQITSPALLLLAGCLGFIVGELTRGERKSALDDKSTPAASPLLQVAENVVELVRPIFLAEFGKIMQAFSSVASAQIADQVSRFFTKPTHPFDDT